MHPDCSLRGQSPGQASCQSNANLTCLSARAVTRYSQHAAQCTARLHAVLTTLGTVIVQSMAPSSSRAMQARLLHSPWKLKRKSVSRAMHSSLASRPEHPSDKTSAHPHLEQCPAHLHHGASSQKTRSSSSTTQSSPVSQHVQPQGTAIILCTAQLTCNTARATVGQSTQPEQSSAHVYPATATPRPTACESASRNSDSCSSSAARTHYSCSAPNLT